MVTGVNLVQVDREVDVVPHVVINLHMVIKSLWKRGAPSINLNLKYITLNMMKFRGIHIYTNDVTLTSPLRSNSWLGRPHMKHKDFWSTSVRYYNRKERYVRRVFFDNWFYWTVPYYVPLYKEKVIGYMGLMLSILVLV